MSTAIRTSSEKQMNQIRRFTKKNNNYYTITLFGLTISESEKFIKDFIKTNHLTKVEAHATAA